MKALKCWGGRVIPRRLFDGCQLAASSVSIIHPYPVVDTMGSPYTDTRAFEPDNVDTRPLPSVSVQRHYYRRHSICFLAKLRYQVCAWICLCWCWTWHKPPMGRNTIIPILLCVGDCGSKILVDSHMQAPSADQCSYSLKRLIANHIHRQIATLRTPNPSNSSVRNFKSATYETAFPLLTPASRTF